MSSRGVAVVVSAVALLVLAAGGVAGAGPGGLAADGAQTDDRSDNATGIEPPAAFDDLDTPGVYSADVSEVVVIELAVAGPGGGGAGYDTDDEGDARDGGDGGYVEGTFDVSEFDSLDIVVGEGGGGGDMLLGPGDGGAGYSEGGAGGFDEDHTAGGGGGGTTALEADGTTLAVAGGGGGGSAWDEWTTGTGSDESGGGGGAAGGEGGSTSFYGGTDGEDAEAADGEWGTVGGDGADADDDEAFDGGSGAGWTNEDHTSGAQNIVTGDGAEGGLGGGEAGEDGEDGFVAWSGVVISDVEAPDSVDPTGSLTVEYTLENVGNAEGTEAFVDLLVEGTDSTFDDTDNNVAVPAGGTTTGTLTLDDVGEFFEDGDSIEWSVELWTYEDTASGTTGVEFPGELTVDGLDFPPVIEPEDALDVEYTVENVGSETATESAVDLVVDGAAVDTDEDVTVDPGETASGVLSFGATEYGDGDTIPFAVELADFDETATGETDVEDVGDGPTLVVADLTAPSGIGVADDLTVEYTVENIGDEFGTESAVELLVEGAVEDTDSDVAVPAGETATGTLTFDAVEGSFDPGETIEWTVGLDEFGDEADGETDVLTADEVNLAVTPSVAEVDPGGEQTFEVVVQSPGKGVLAYEDLVVEIDDTDVGTIESFDEPFEPVVSNSKVQADGSTLHLEAVTGDAFTDPADELVLATFDVAADGSEGDLTGLEFDVTADNTVATFEDGTPYEVDERLDATMVVSGQDGPNLAVSADAPATVDPGEDLDVEYTVENVGDETGTESAVELLVGGGVEDADSAVEVPAGGTATGTLTFDGVEESFDPGETIEWTVELDDFDDDASGETTVAGEPELVVAGLEYPESIGPDDTLAVGYTIENAGDGPGTESFVDLVVDGDFVDTDEDVAVDPGETASGELSFAAEEYDSGETIAFAVELWDFGDSESGSTTVSGGEAAFGVSITGTNDPVEQGNPVEVTVTVENTGDVEATETVTLDGGSLGDDAAEVTLEGGESTEETLTVGTGPGDAGEHPVTVEVDDDAATETVDLHLPPLPGQDNPPQSLDDDDLVEDIRGDGELTIFDVQTFFNTLGSETVQENEEFFDFHGDGGVGIQDVQALFEKL